MPDKSQDYQRFLAMIQEFSADSDRATVVLAAASLDNQLLRLLRLFLRPVPGKNDDLLEGESPLGSFSARITACHRLQLIDDEFASALHMIRRTRNTFAHEATGHTLANSPHRERIESLIHLWGRGDKWIAWIRNMYFGKRLGPGIDFRVTVAFMMLRLDGAIETVQRIASPWEVGLHPPGEAPEEPEEESPSGKE